MGNFRTLRKRVKAIFMGLSGIVPSHLASLTRMPRSFLGIYFQAPATRTKYFKSKHSTFQKHLLFLNYC